jgi:hypothetical protein
MTDQHALLAVAGTALLIVLLLMFGRQQAKFAVTIRAPARIVWEHWIVACGHNDWRPLADIESVEQLSQAPMTIRVKAAGKGLIDQPIETVWRYDIFEPYRRYEVKVVSGGSPAGESGQLTESGGETRLEFSVSARWSGAAGAWFAGKRVEGTLQALKSVCEAKASEGNQGVKA